MSKQVYSKEGEPFASGIKDRVIRVYPKIRSMIPRLIKYKGKYFFDLRFFKLNSARQLYPTKFGIRIDMEDFFKLRGIVGDISKRLEKRGIKLEK